MSDLHDPRYARLRVPLREARLSAGLTQVEAAKQLGKSQQFISRSEAGDRRIDALDLSDFADLYGQPVAWLLERRS